MPWYIFYTILFTSISCIYIYLYSIQERKLVQNIIEWVSFWIMENMIHDVLYKKCTHTCRQRKTVFSKTRTILYTYIYTYSVPFGILEYEYIAILHYITLYILHIVSATFEFSWYYWISFQTFWITISFIFKRKVHTSLNNKSWTKSTWKSSIFSNKIALKTGNKVFRENLNEVKTTHALSHWLYMFGGIENIECNAMWKS